MNRVIDEMSKVQIDVERRMRLRIPEIIEECKRFAWLGKMFSFDYDQELDKKVNAILISLSDDIMEDIEARAKRVIREAEMEDEEDAIFAYMKREINEEDLTERLDKHCSTLRHFLEGWIAIGFAESISKQDLVSDIFAYMDNPYASPLWQSAYSKGYASNAVKSQNYSFGKGNLRNPLKALFLVAETAINTAFQYGKVLFFRMKGAIGYRTHRNSSFDCPYCDELTRRIHPLTDIVLPAHPRCVCYSTPVYKDDEAELFMRIQERREKYNELLNNPNYKDVAFNEINGGLKATHIQHNLNKGKGWYETTVQDVGYKSGHMVILEAEIHNVYKQRNCEGTWDGLKFEIAASETGTSSNIRNGLKHCASKPDCNVAVLFMLNGIGTADFRNGLSKYNGLKKDINQWKEFKAIYAIDKDGHIKLLPSINTD